MKEWLKAESYHDVGLFYDQHYRQNGAESFTEDRKEILDLLHRFSCTPGEPFSAYKRILDAGCGNGQFLEHLCDRMECVGIEVSVEAFLLAKKKLSHIAVVRQMAIEEIPHDWEGRFDYVTCLGVLEHTMNPKLCFDRLYASLSSGGILLVTVPLEFNDCFSYIRQENNQKTNERFASIDEWRKFFGTNEEAFTVVGEGETKHVALIYRRAEE